MDSCKIPLGESKWILAHGHAHSDPVTIKLIKCGINYTLPAFKGL